MTQPRTSAHAPMARTTARALPRLLAAALGLALPAAAAFAQDAPGTTVLTAARMLDVRSGRMIDTPQVQVRDGRIVAVGRVGDAAPEGANRIDLPGMTLLPGLVDMHVHLDSDPTYGGYTGLQFGDRFWSMLTVPHAQRTLEAGFTTVRNVGSDAWNDVGLRQAIEAGKIAGPQIGRAHV